MKNREMKEELMTITENPTGKKFWFDSFLMEVLVSAADTDGSLSVCKQTHRAGYGTPVHVHEREDQTLFVLEGTITAWLDPMGDRVEKVVEAGEGVFLPRGVPHAFHVEADSELLEINTPGGFEGFHIAAGEPAQHDGLPEPSAPDIEKLMRHGADYACEVLGPPVGAN